MLRVMSKYFLCVLLLLAVLSLQGITQQRESAQLILPDSSPSETTTERSQKQLTSNWNSFDQMLTEFIQTADTLVKDSKQHSSQVEISQTQVSDLQLKLGQLQLQLDNLETSHAEEKAAAQKVLDDYKIKLDKLMKRVSRDNKVIGVLAGTSVLGWGAFLILLLL